MHAHRLPEHSEYRSYSCLTNILPSEAPLEARSQAREARPALTAWVGLLQRGRLAGVTGR